MPPDRTFSTFRTRCRGKTATVAFESIDYARALERTEAFFWSFTDDYVELVKGRAYGGQGDDQARAAHVALATALDTLLRLFAPFLPFVTEEVWSWANEGSVHRAAWPDAAALAAQATRAGAVDTSVLDVAGEILSEVRRAKTEAKQSLRAEVERCVITDTSQRLALVQLASADIEDAGRIDELVLQNGDATVVEVTLAQES